MNRNAIHCTKESDIPKTKHWAIIETRTGSEAGYDRGDPSTTFNYIGYTAYLDKADWEKEIVEKTQRNLTSNYSRTPFVALEVSPAIVNTAISINIH